MTIIHGDCRTILPTLETNSIDAIITDPPYEISFLNHAWDKSGIVYDIEMWKQCLRVLKPGGHMLVFGATRTHHRIWSAIEDAGFQIIDNLFWAYATGFAKGLNISKAIDKHFGAIRPVIGQAVKRSNTTGLIREQPNGFNHKSIHDITAPATNEANQWDGWNTQLKPAVEVICVARKPLSEPTYAENILKWGVGAFNVKKCNVPSNERDRYPANLMHDNSDEVLFYFPNETSKYFTSIDDDSRLVYIPKATNQEKDAGLDGLEKKTVSTLIPATNDVSKRFASIRANTHTTVKPIKLMAYLCNLITPLNGMILDPFAGSCSTGCAAVANGFDFIGIEINKEYADIGERRMKHWSELLATAKGVEDGTIPTINATDWTDEEMMNFLENFSKDGSIHHKELEQSHEIL